MFTFLCHFLLHVHEIVSNNETSLCRYQVYFLTWGSWQICCKCSFNTYTWLVLEVEQENWRQSSNRLLFWSKTGNNFTDHSLNCQKVENKQNLMTPCSANNSRRAFWKSLYRNGFILVDSWCHLGWRALCCLVFPVWQMCSSALCVSEPVGGWASLIHSYWVTIELIRAGLKPHPDWKGQRESTRAVRCQQMGRDEKN